MGFGSGLPGIGSVLGVLGRGGKEDACGSPGDPGRIRDLDFSYPPSLFPTWRILIVLTIRQQKQQQKKKKNPPRVSRNPFLGSVR